MFKEVIADITGNRARRIRSVIARRLLGRTEVRYRYVYLGGSRDSRAAIWSSFVDSLKAKGLPIILGGETNTSHKRVNIRRSAIADVLQTTFELFGSGRVFVLYEKQWRHPVTQDLVSNFTELGASVNLLILDEDFVCQPSRAQPHLQLTGQIIEVVTWAKYSGAYGKSYFESGRKNRVAKRLRSETFARLTKAGHNFNESVPAADLPNFPVDIVYTWVDGDDPAWRARKEQSQAGSAIVAGTAAVAHDERFRSREELKYSLRSVEAYAPWVRTIHIVTDDQCPDWLNTDHPRIRLVDHKDIYSDQACLPTFNSSGIETQLHHVPGLADKFLYFNDDFFLGRFCEITDFFLGNGMLKYFPSGQMAYEYDIDSTSEEYIQADKNVIEMLSRDFPAVNRQIMQHAPYASDRLMLQEMEERYPQAFADCASANFRSTKDIRPIAFMQYHYGYNMQRAVPANISHRYLGLWKDTIIEQMDNVARSRRYKTFCINDVGLQAERTAEVNEAVVNFLESYFPVPSSFER